jgi:hypothetical protein
MCAHFEPELYVAVWLAVEQRLFVVAISSELILPEAQTFA